MYERLQKLWRDGQLPFIHEPKKINTITSGISNHSFLIDADSQTCVARVSDLSEPYPGTDARREHTILQEVSMAGLAPNIIFHSIPHGILITEYISGRPWETSDADNSERLEQLLELISTMHRLDTDLPGFNYFSHAENYCRILKDRGMTLEKNFLLQQKNLLQELKHLRYQARLTHHDMHANNILVTTDKIYLLDWEYAVPGWALFDYASLTVECAISTEQIQLATAYDKNELLLAQSLYSHLCQLWQLFHASRQKMLKPIKTP